MSFMDIFKKKPEETASKSKGLSILSTDLPMGAITAQALQEARERSFQVDISKIATHTPAGSLTTDACDIIPARTYHGPEFGVPEAQFLWYASQGFIGHEVAAMIAQNWLVAKACAMPARDAVRTGFDISVEGGAEVPDEAMDDLKKLDVKYKLNHNLVEFVRMGRVFGLRIALFVVDGIDYSLPFNIDGVKKGSYRGISQLDPYWVSPELDASAVANPAAIDFYEPTFWNVQGVRIHKSHLVIFKGDEVADTLKPTYKFGGIPVPQKIYERVYCAERTANEAPQLAMTKRVTALYTDLAQAIASEGKFAEKIARWAGLRDNYGVKVLGTEERIEQFDCSLTDLDAAIMTQYQIVAAAANVPATKLLGTTPKGFNSTGEYEEASYHEELETIQTHDLTPFITRHKELCIKSEVAPKYKIPPFSVEVAWKPVDTLTAVEQSDVNLKKAQTGEALVMSGAIDSYEERQRLIADPDSGYANLSNETPGFLADPLGLNDVIEASQGLTLDAALFDPENGTFDGAILITNQEYLDDEKVKEKSAKMDYEVQVSPVFRFGGKDYRIIIDGHHSLAAAINDDAMPVFAETDYEGSDYKNAITKGYAFDTIGVK